MSKPIKAVVEVVIGEVKRKLTVEVRGGLKGTRLLDAIDKKVEAALKGQKWDRWNLVDIIEE